MTKVLILYYSAYGHMERMAQAVAEGVREAGAQADNQASSGTSPAKMSPSSPDTSWIRPRRSRNCCGIARL